MLDASHWKVPVSDHMRLDIVKNDVFRNLDGPFLSKFRQGNTKGQQRQLTKDWFHKVMQDRERILRKWMVYSPIFGKLYCFCCRLFCIQVSSNSSVFITGFDQWWKLNPKVSNHESSEKHLNCLEKWKTLAVAMQCNSTIDAVVLSSMEEEKIKWKNILYRLLDIVLFLSKQNLPFRGHRETEASLNKGNFLELVELLSKYDPVLKEHLVRLKQASRHLQRQHVTYLSPQTQNEFIGLLAAEVKRKLIAEIKSAKYYGIIFDSTPDISHTDQMSEIIRLVHVDGQQVQIKEVFLVFLS